MELDDAKLLSHALANPKSKMAINTRSTINRVLETAMIDESAMQQVLDMIQRECQPEIAKGFSRLSWLNYLRWRWVRFKVSRWGVSSITQNELMQCLGQPQQLYWLRSRLHKDFRRGNAGLHWWKARVESADRFLEKDEMRYEHVDAVRSYQIWLNTREDKPNSA